jgi:hypothetical protein
MKRKQQKVDSSRRSRWAPGITLGIFSNITEIANQAVQLQIADRRPARNAASWLPSRPVSAEGQS